MRIAFVIYRAWAFGIYKDIAAFQESHPDLTIEALVTTPAAEFRIPASGNRTKVYVVEGKDNDRIALILSEHRVDVVFYYGWSWIVKGPVLKDYLCLCLHPSPLPKYRGGSPMQHQIINGETESAATVFKMGEGIDDGDIYESIPFSLEGTIGEIYRRLEKNGAAITRHFITDFMKGNIEFTPQQGLDRNPPLKRRTPAQSEIDFGTLGSLPYRSLYNMVRALADPYPNAFIKIPSGKFLIQAVEERSEARPNEIADATGSLETIVKKGATPCLRLADGFAAVTKYRIERL